MGLVYKKIRQIFCIAHYQYMEWILNGKQIIVLIVLFFLMQYVTNPIIALAKEIGLPIHWAEPFLAAVNSIYTIPLVIFCFITLMCDFPKRNYENINMIFYTKRTNWYFGQLLFCIYAIGTFMAEMVGLFLVRTLWISYLDNGWSPITKHYMEQYLDIGRKNGVVAVVPSEVYNHFSPELAFFYSLLLFAGMFFLISLIIMLFNFINKKTIGIILNILLVVSGLGMIYIKSSYLKFLPIGNAVLRCQNLPVTMLTDFYYPITYFILINLFFIIIGRIMIKKIKL